MDHLLVSPSISDRLRSAGVNVEIRGPRDHAPAWIELDRAHGTVRELANCEGKGANISRQALCSGIVSSC